MTPRRSGPVQLTAAAALLALTACAAPPAPAEAPPAPWEATVTSVTDGDTIRVTTAEGAEARLRVMGIDSPELGHRGSGEPVAPGECYAGEATEFARQTLLNRIVTIVPDPSQDRVDRYGRLLGYVQLAPAEGGQDYSTLAAAAGMARAYVYHRDRPPQRIVAIRAAEEQARAAGRGLWSCSTASTATPATTRRVIR